MKFLKILMSILIASLFGACNTVKTVKPDKVSNVQVKGIYEGTYTRRIHGSAFVDGATGNLWFLPASDDFMEKTKRAGEKAIKNGSQETAFIYHIKVKGKLSPPPKINRYEFKRTLNVENVIFIEPVKFLIPKNCFRTVHPCSSDGMSPYRP